MIARLTYLLGILTLSVALCSFAPFAPSAPVVPVVPASTLVAYSTCAAPASAAVMDIKPRVLTLTADSTEYVSARVKVLNRGGTPCTITAINPSCGCGAATVLKNPVQPMDIAEIAIRINTSNMKDSVNTVEFVIESDAENSPYVFKAVVRKSLPPHDTMGNSHR
ncbi:MAG: hypothetical protein RL156_1115 [Bacteroidota bacterium]